MKPSTRFNTTWRESRALHLLSLVLIAIFLVWARSRAQRSGHVSFPEEVVFSIFEPFQSFFSGVGHRVSERWDSLRHLRTLEEDNRRLRQELAELQAKNQRLYEQFHENQRLRKLLAMEPKAPAQKVIAEVVSASSSSWFRRVRLNRGYEDGVAPKDPVITNEGVVGQILSVSRHTSLTLLITDQDSGVGGMIDRSRAVGVVKGTGEEVCNMIYLDANADVREGDLVVTSQLGEVFPKGIILGKVQLVEKALHYSSQVAVVKPAVDLNRLEEVFVLKSAGAQ